ncbi:MAG: hypothetical protein JWO56_1856 [Acidobacteria bacterium]|nr:hypothetical protein [Acidobacteriota bacterium]
MPVRRLAAALSIAVLFLGATPKKKKPVPARAASAAATFAPDDIPHPQAMYLAGLSHDGKDRVTFKAAAYGKHFFLEEPSGVTVYRYDGSGYRKETFLAKTTLASAMKKFPDEMKK